MVELQRLLQVQERLRMQQAKSKWIKEADANTKFFHVAVERRSRYNRLKGIRIDGRWMEDVKEVNEGIRGFFEKHFKKREDEVFSMMKLDGKKIEEEDRWSLERPFEE